MKSKIGPLIVSSPVFIAATDKMWSYWAPASPEPVAARWNVSFIGRA